MSKKTLLPCPLCGGEFKMSQHPGEMPFFSPRFNLYHARETEASLTCPVEVTRHFDTACEAVAAWNTRATVSAVQADRMLTILHHMSLENTDWFRRIWRWAVPDEPLRNDAAHLLRDLGYVGEIPRGTRRLETE